MDKYMINRADMTLEENLGNILIQWIRVVRRSKQGRSESVLSHNSGKSSGFGYNDLLSAKLNYPDFKSRYNNLGL